MTPALLEGRLCRSNSVMPTVGLLLLLGAWAAISACARQSASPDQLHTARPDSNHQGIAPMTLTASNYEAVLDLVRSYAVVKHEIQSCEELSG